MDTRGVAVATEIASSTGYRVLPGARLSGTLCLPNIRILSRQGRLTWRRHQVHNMLQVLGQCYGAGIILVRTESKGPVADEGGCRSSIIRRRHYVNAMRDRHLLPSGTSTTAGRDRPETDGGLDCFDSYRIPGAVCRGL